MRDKIYLIAAVMVIVHLLVEAIGNFIAGFITLARMF